MTATEDGTRLEPTFKMPCISNSVQPNIGIQKGKHYHESLDNHDSFIGLLGFLIMSFFRCLEGTDICPQECQTMSKVQNPSNIKCNIPYTLYS
jgi:hypothetical protein